MTTICSHCGKELKEMDKEFIICKVCNKFTPKNANSYKNKKEGNNKMSDLTKWGKLKCSVCGKDKHASQDRVEKWKDKKYICRACKKDKKE